MENLIIPDEKKLNELILKIAKDGKEKLHVVADFDRTLTKAFVGGQKAHTVIAQIRQGNYLTPDYSPRAHQLSDIYHPIEINPNILPGEKNAKMQEWWKRHFDLLFEYRLDMKVMKKIVSEKTIRFREGALEFLDLLNKNKIPLIIISASVGDMISMYLEQESRLYNNIHIVSNFFKFDKNNKVIGLKGKIIHSLNKHESEIKEMPFYKNIKERKNILVMGDGLDDLGMIQGAVCENMIKIGFLNENIQENLENFKKNFDVIITNDSDMNYVNELLGKIF